MIVVSICPVNRRSKRTNNVATREGCVAKFSPQPLRSGNSVLTLTQGLGTKLQGLADG